MNLAKGQTAFEYMAIVALVLAILLPLSIFVFNQTEAQTRGKQAEIAVNSIANAANVLYAQGAGAKTIVEVYLPEGYSGEKSLISNKIISIKYYVGKDLIEASAATKANITGSMPASGRYKIFSLEMLGNVVNITAR